MVGVCTYYEGSVFNNFMLVFYSRLMITLVAETMTPHAVVALAKMYEIGFRMSLLLRDRAYHKSGIYTTDQAIPELE